METVNLISWFLLFGYMTSVIILFGIPASISDSFYLLNGMKEGLGTAFTVWCVSMSFLVAVQMFGFADGAWYQFLGLFACGGLGFTGVAPHFKLFERSIHYASAGVCAVSSALWIVFSGYWFIVASSVAVALAVSVYEFLRVGKSDEKHAVFFVEYALFAAMLLTLLFLNGYG